MFKAKNPIIAAVSLAMGVGMASSAQAGPALFDTQTNGTISVAVLDWNPTSFLALGGVSAIGAFQSPTGCTVVGGVNPCAFEVLTHATLGNFQSAPNVNINNTGLNVNYEVTMIAKFREVVTDVTTVSGRPTVGFSLQATPTEILVYYDTARNSNAISGFGYNDGVLILRATEIVSAPGSFSITATAGLTQLDQAGDEATVALKNDYGAQQTVTGSGTHDPVAVGSIQQDFNYFLNSLVNFNVNFPNISQSLPFTTAEPSDCFTRFIPAANLALDGAARTAFACDNVHVANTPYSGQLAIADAVNGYVPIVGINNGLIPAQGGGSDFVAQTDFSTGLDAVVPEPASLALVGLGLGLLGLGARRGRRCAKK